MIIVKVDNGNIEKALKIFKKKCLSTKILQELRDRQFYMKPSERKRMKKNKAIYVQKKYRNNEE
jgi:small subunit ribosomal protein S21